MKSQICIVGGGPAGMVAGLLFARAGIETLVIEKHADFLRDFRGDTVHPSTLAIFAELGLLDRLLAVPHEKVEQLSARVAGRLLRIADFRRLRTPAPYIALMPQWDFLDFVAREARRYPNFTLRQSVAATGLIDEGGRVAGVRLADGEVRAGLVIAADGRHSVLRDQSGLPSRTIGAPMDIFWFRIPKTDGVANDSMGVFQPGLIFVMIDRGSYWQCAFVFPKGAADAIRTAGIDAFRERVRAVGPEMAAADALRGWDDVKLLTVAVDRLERWHRPGLLVIGDAAHAMSPIGGVGINLAVQDAVAAANALAGPIAAGADPEPLLALVEKRRMLPTRLTQAAQKLVQDRIIAPLLTGEVPMTRPPLPARLLDRFAVLRAIPARAVGLGVRPEHVWSPEAKPSRD
jgi:2-polyprenyl-6-methoxyphenol hydroxylase-like FAD-dependent oxidoreductase